ncbi:Pfs, NACHT and ankyrin domain protein [Aureobasidium pullulans]|nr:Pfs, NACHT and ankyrin domain protein [Aureobasidium pullulans]
MCSRAYTCCQALIRSKEYFTNKQDLQLGSIGESTLGVIFLATPHRGSEKVRFADVIYIAAKLTGNLPNDHLLNALRKDSGVLEAQRASFATISKEMPIKCIYEELTTIRHMADHIAICKFDSRDDGGYEKVKNFLLEMYQEAGPWKMIQEADAWIRDKHYTTEHLEITRLSGSPLPLDRCYINLTLIDQHRKHLDVSSNGEGEGPPSSSLPFSLVARLNIEAPRKEDFIKLPTLFDQRERLPGNKQQARRIFIRGRAGVGETTLCKKIVHDFITEVVTDHEDAVAIKTNKDGFAHKRPSYHRLDRRWSLSISLQASNSLAAELHDQASAGSSATASTKIFVYPKFFLILIMANESLILDSRELYTVGWIAALPLELAAASAVLDEEHKPPSDFEKPSMDKNSYTWGRIGEHNVVITSLAAGVYGTTSAATTATQMLSSIPSIRVGLMVGIGAAIARPEDGVDIRLGDVVISQPNGGNGGVVQYDLRKAKSGHRFERKDVLNMPPEALLKALAQLQAKHERSISLLPQILEEMIKGNPQMAKSKPGKPSYTYQGRENDRLFSSSFEHVGGGRGCKNCDQSQEIIREDRESNDPEIHYGTIASGNTLVKDSVTRDDIFLNDGTCVCLEMEAAGLMNSFPCLVIRGICDYADSHKNDQWQRYAAAVAAAYAKEFLGFVDNVDLAKTSRATEALQRISDELPKLRTGIENARDRMQELSFDNQQREIMQWLSAPDPSIDYHEALEKRHDGTGLWFLESDVFLDWKTRPHSFLWLCGIPGCGKTVLSSSLIQDHAEVKSHVVVTSRPEEDITAAFETWMRPEDRILLQQTDIDKDIRAYIRHKIRHDKELRRRWQSDQKVQQDIEDKIMSKADGMFRWASCQLDALQQCLDQLGLEEELENLPRDLYETYDRILKSIPEKYRRMATTILQLLTHSDRPLRLSEIVDAIAVQPNRSPSFQTRYRMPFPRDVLRVCSSLVVLVHVADYDELDGMDRNTETGDGEKALELRLAHFSVKEYLVSDRVQQDYKKSLEESQARMDITHLCLTYMSDLDHTLSLSEIRVQFSFSQYSASYWTDHARAVTYPDMATQERIMTFFHARETAYMTCYSLYRPDKGGKHNSRAEVVPNPIYFASLGGLEHTVQQMLERNVDVNVRGGVYGTALQAASEAGHDTIVQMLLDKGADVNAIGGEYDTALQAASFRGYDTIVKILLDKGADVNA